MWNRGWGRGECSLASVKLGSLSWFDPQCTSFRRPTGTVFTPLFRILKRVKVGQQTPSVPHQSTALIVSCVLHIAQATKLYYHVLELVLTAEDPSRGPPSQRSNTALLTSSKLHKGLMACSLELIMACYKWVR